MLHRINVDPNLEKVGGIPKDSSLLLTKEIIAYSLPRQEEMEGMNALSLGGKDLALIWKETFQTRIIQHHIRVAPGRWNEACAIDWS